MKRLVLSALILFSFVFSFYAADLTDSETAVIHKVLDARLQTRLYSNNDDAISFMKSYRQSIENDAAYKACGEEAQFIVQNLLIIEQYNYMYQKDMKSAELKPFILGQYEKIDSFQTQNSNKSLSPWFYFSSGDVINSSMQFIPQSTAIKLGLKEKDEYDNAVKANPKISFGYINKGLWYYFAPGIGGGSKSVGKKDFQQAVENAACDYEKFYARIYYSQALYDEGKKAECASLLSECDKILPQNIYIPFVKKLNDNGYSLFDYVINREKIEKKLGL